MTEIRSMLERAQQFLEAATSEAAAGRLETSFHLARTSAELAGKILLLRKLGTYPETRHDIGGQLSREGLVPQGVDKARLASLLTQSSRGAYGFNDPILRREVERACQMASRMVEAAKRGHSGSA